MIGRRLLALAAAVLLSACAAPAPQPAIAETAVADERLVIVAVADVLPDVLPGVGTTPRGDYRRNPGYAGSAAATAAAASVARTYGLREQRAWTIEPLALRCMVYAIAADADRDAVIATLQRDPRVLLAQPLNGFETLASAYNDPYVGLQRGFAAINAEPAQRYSRGEGVSVAVIDSGIDAAHPDLAGRVASARDFVGGSSGGGSSSAAERHGTQVAGIIAATANNGVGIVGVAPGARLLAYRACWAVAGSAGSRCDSYTLAQALGAAIAAQADIINLSLGGPADPLLQRLAEHALRRGTIVIAALPTSGRAEGFPAGVPGVIGVGVADGAPSRLVTAPGREILTLEPGGGYDYASGSSLASAHVSGVAALLRSLAPKLDAAAMRALLEREGGQPVDACAALRRLRADSVCTTAAPF